jgi:uncharacterized membrane protein
MNVSEGSADMMNHTSESTNCTNVFEDYAFTIVAVVNMVVGFFSFITCCFTILLIAALKKWQFFSQRLILYLTITAMLISLANIINRVDFAQNPSDALIRFCIFGGFLTQVTSWMTLCSITSITVYLFLRTTFKKNTEKYEPLYVLFIFGFPFLFNWIPFINVAYGRAGVWCWIQSFDYTNCEELQVGKWLQFGLFYIPGYSILLVLIILYVLIIVKVCRQKKVHSAPNNPRNTKTDVNKVVRKMVNEVLTLAAYPVIYFLLTLPLVINRIYTTATPRQPSLFLWYLAVLAFPLMGACIGFTFTFNTMFRRRITWAELRSRTMSRTDSNRRISTYPMKTDEMSDSAAIHASNRVFHTDYHNNMVDYHYNDNDNDSNNM